MAKTCQIVHNVDPIIPNILLEGLRKVAMDEGCNDTEENFRIQNSAAWFVLRLGMELWNEPVLDLTQGVANLEEQEGVEDQPRLSSPLASASSKWSQPQPPT